MTTAPTFKDRLRADLTQAMKARDEARTSTLRMAIAAIGKAEVAGDEAITLSDDAALALLASEVKKRHEAADLYDQGGRTELAAKERTEAQILGKYLPAALSDDELAAIVADEVAAAAVDAANPGKAMGAVIKAVRARVGQQADGNRIAAAVKAALS
jgi:uncharacterized protein YqeY